MLAGAGPAQAERLLRDTYRVTEGRRRLAMDCAGASLAALRSLAPGEVSLLRGHPLLPHPVRLLLLRLCRRGAGPQASLSPFLGRPVPGAGRHGGHAGGRGARVRTVYFGGGTPTTLTAEQLTALLKAVRENFDLSTVREYTVEAGRPDTITKEKLDALKAGGVTRISINPQTMHDKVLAAIGRRHTAAQTVEAFHLARAAGFSNINMDLIAGLPADTAAGFADTLRQVIELSPESVTVHTLSLKRASDLNQSGEGAARSAGNEVADMLHTARALLGAGPGFPLITCTGKAVRLGT